LDELNKLRAKELSLEQTTSANEDYKSQIAWLTKKMESKLPSPLSSGFCIVLDILLMPLRITESDAKLNTLKMMVENAVSFSYPNDSSSATHAPQLLDGLPTRSWEVILAKMKQATSLTLGILRSLYPRANLDIAGDGFAVTYTNEEAFNLMEDSTGTADRIIDMIKVNMS
jgi:hypothetical protein